MLHYFGRPSVISVLERQEKNLKDCNKAGQFLAHFVVGSLGDTSQIYITTTSGW